MKAHGCEFSFFAQYTETLDVIQEYASYREWPFLRLDGATNRVTRELEVRAFNAPDSPYFLYLISTRAGGQGINLASADAVVLYDSCYNPQVDLQVMRASSALGTCAHARMRAHSFFALSGLSPSS